jgi:hypothetical protein
MVYLLIFRNEATGVLITNGLCLQNKPNQLVFDSKLKKENLNHKVWRSQSQIQ